MTPTASQPKALDGGANPSLCRDPLGPVPVPVAPAAPPVSAASGPLTQVTDVTVSREPSGSVVVSTTRLVCDAVGRSLFWVDSLLLSVDFPEAEARGAVVAAALSWLEDVSAGVDEPGAVAEGEDGDGDSSEDEGADSVGEVVVATGLVATGVDCASDIEGDRDEV